MQLWNSTKSVDANFRFQIRHAFISRSLSHYTDSLTWTTHNHSQITSRGTQKNIYWESVPTTRISAYTHTQQKADKSNTHDTVRFGYEKVRLIRKGWICKGNRFSCLCSFVWRQVVVWITQEGSCDCNLHVFLTSTVNVSQYSSLQAATQTNDNMQRFGVSLA